MDKKIKVAQHKRLIAVASIKALESFMQAFKPEEAGQLPEALEVLEQHRQDFFVAVAKLEECDDSSEAIQACIADRIDMEARCRRLKSFFRENQRKDATLLNDSLLANSTLAFGRPNASNFRFPKIELPTFDGDTTKWLSFRDRFVAMIDASAELPSIAKLQYLLSSLKGDAAVPFEHVSLTTENYETTWAALLKRYDNTKMLIREYWRRLHFLPAIEAECVEGLTVLVDEFVRHVNGLVKLQEPVESWDTPLSNMLMMKLDNETILAWEKHSVQRKKDKYSELIDFLQDRIRILNSSQRIAGDRVVAPIKVAGAHRSPAPRRSVTNAASVQRTPSSSHTIQQASCPLQCADHHLIRNCPVFLSKNIQERRDTTRAKGLCWNCLSGSHQVRMCKSDYSCRSCKERHHTLLHQTPQQPTVALSAQSDDDMVFLETATIFVVDDYGERHKARALLDSGSMSNFITDALARKLMKPRTKVNISVSGIGTTRQQIKGSIIANVSSRDLQFTTPLELLILDTPSADIPTSPIDVSAWNIPNVTLADPTYHIPGKVDVVIGGDTFWELHTGRKQSLGSGLPWLVETQFGWAVAGNTTHSSQQHRVCNVATNDGPLETIMTRFWESETIFDEPILSVEEDICERHFLATTTRDHSGRYVVRLPQNPNPIVVLGESKAIADRRLLAVERRLKANPTMNAEYSKFMTEYERLGHMKLLTEPVDDKRDHYYLPHHAVLKESSTTTKVRVVFDASCKTSTGYSLNDKLLVGPVIQDDLFTIIVRFRSHAVALSADVEKMYRQVLHDSRDRDYLRIRYREDPAGPIQTYQLQTVTYGTACAPFLATRTLKQIAYDYNTQYPRAVDPVLHDFYVDDLLTGTEEVSAAVEIRTQISEMLKQAGFILKKWASNSPEALANIPPEDLAILPTHELHDHQSVSTLGLVWEPSTDLLRYRIDLPMTTTVLTKRLALSYIAKIFDPLGLLSPSIIIAKLFMQQLWKLQDNGKPWDWDSELPSHLQKEWTAFHSKLQSLREVGIPRYALSRPATNVQLHMFADASQLAYGACCYVRVENGTNTSVQLLAAKSKVVSLANTHSIARLELCAARLATQLFRKVSQSLTGEYDTIAWTDSMTVLHWLNSTPRRWKPFVANRVAQIQGEAGIKCWRHVPGVDNPADDVSRGLLPDKLQSCQRWWHGPHWLSRKQEDWPMREPAIEETASIEEERATQPRVAASTIVNAFNGYLFARFSTYLKLRRTMAYCLRFVHCLKVSKSTGTSPPAKNHASLQELIAVVPPLSFEELLQAELQLCKLAQQDSFSDDLVEIQAGNGVLRNTRLKWLSPFIDASGILRVGGRLGNAQIADSAKYPILLSAKHPLSSLLAVSYHEKHLHAGPELLLSVLRQRFWVIGGRNLAKSVFHRCHRCFKTKPTLVQQSVADLPTSRVSPTRPFAVSGVDYCGPVLLKSTIRNRSPTKAYIAIFVCFATRAVHIELVSDLTTAAFLAALRRFVARRGKILELHSDNATTFKGAAHELHRLYEMFKCSNRERMEIFNWCANEEIQWKFIPPRAPHFGGLWEAAVRSVKQHLIRTIGGTSLTQEGMTTLLAQIEQCLNSRPLIPLSSDPSDLQPLTPGHFLVGSNMLAIPQVDRSQVPANRLREFQLIEKHMQYIWSRWYPEYLQQLQARAKRVVTQPVKLQVGQLVIIREDNVPPTLWPMGRITRLHPGKDGVVRVVTLRTAAGKEIVRAVARLAILPNPNACEDK